MPDPGPAVARSKHDAEKAAMYEQCPTLADFERQRSTFDEHISVLIYWDYYNCMCSVDAQVTHEAA